MTFDAKTIYKVLQTHFQKRVRLNEPMARHCTFGVGGPADVWVSLDTSRELIDLVRMCIEEQWPLLLVGNGTNILFADTGGRGIPGTLGGGVISNAGAHNSDLGEVLEWIEVLDARGASTTQEGVSVPIIQRYLHDEIDLSYRHSRFRASRRIDRSEERRVGK